MRRLPTIGRSFTAGTAIEASLISGEVLPSRHYGVYFAILAPEATVEGATVTATGADGRVIATAPVPAG
ncbi:hypothetical protein [Catellatospora chokoriensis]|uniref:Uncharacterized protein n=1 Tax=Catellatospora chokoriensis TaxID=310353 RepID=A0A8J3K288_9ACTN|nr:hypothetical protein [Catellatospora chokoriensis]GIF91621.1 hypothetical protein Cch02nite_50650 [Catellatospora chokoriensis]